MTFWDGNFPECLSLILSVPSAVYLCNQCFPLAGSMTQSAVHERSQMADGALLSTVNTLVRFTFHSFTNKQLSTNNKTWPFSTFHSQLISPSLPLLYFPAFLYSSAEFFLLLIVSRSRKLVEKEQLARFHRSWQSPVLHRWCLLFLVPPPNRLETILALCIALHPKTSLLRPLET